ncbi:hypothetical protein HYH08_17145 [Bradyrhizobium sp. BR 10289]|nr:hypothetical protein [Bradyrhizobium sp. BR 10289]
MITAWAERISVTFATLARRAAEIMNRTLMAPLMPQRYPVAQRAVSIRRHQRRLFDAREH